MPSPEDMRSVVAGYVHEIHRAYVDQAATFSPALRGRMPVMSAAHFTVAAVGVRYLHLLATTEPLGPLRGPEVALDEDYRGVSWQLRFYDPVVIPDLSLVDETGGPASSDVRRALGVGTTIYHLVADVGSGLSGHHAADVGTGLANGHSAVARDFETIRSRVRGREALVDEMSGAAVAGLPHAQALFAQAIAPANPRVREVCAAQPPDPDAIREALLVGVGGRTQWTPPEGSR